MAKKRSKRIYKWSVPTDAGARIITLDLNRPDFHTNVLKALFTGKKSIRVDDASFLDFGRPWSMWKTIPFQVDSVDLELRFRAIGNLAGASLYRDGERIAPESGPFLSSNIVTAAQILQYLVFAAAIIWIGTEYGWASLSPFR
jgi:hypothetical protein